MGEFTVANVAEALGVEAAVARAKLRAAGVTRTDGRYAWSSEKEFKGVLKQLGGRIAEEKAPKNKKATVAEKDEGKKSKKDKKDKKDKGAAPENKTDKKNKK